MRAIQTVEVPSAIGPYSQAMACGETVYLSGQIPLNPKTMQLCSEDIDLQINQVLENLMALCQAAGGSLAQLVKVTIYLTDLNHFPLVNEAMARYFTPPYPARSTIGVFALPRGAKIEMDGVLMLSSGVS